MFSNPIALAVLAAGVGTGAVIDLRTRRVPNALTLTVAAAGIGCAATGVSGLSMRAAFIGFAFGFALMLPGHLLGGTGAGDVKLFAAAGTLLGPAHVALAFFYTALAGGLLALFVASRRRRLARTIDRTRGLIAGRRETVHDIEHPRANNRFAYAPAIALGSVLAALGF